MIDVLILYEHIAREIENCALLAEELSLRGYSVKLKSIFSPVKYFLKPKVIVVPHLYNNNQLIEFAKNIWGNNKCIVDLQYEQLLSKNIPLDDIHNPKGQAINAQHIAWGEEQYNRYIACGIKDNNIHRTGSISMDFLRNEFKEYFYSKQQVAKMYKLSPNVKWVLFVSSFAFVNRSNAEIDEYMRVDSNSRAMAQLSELSYKMVLEWLKNAAIKNPNIVFIYRPHPAEKNDLRLYKMEQEIVNFKCIRDMSMRQWATVVDKIYVWFSTSISDIYYARKPCGLIRPVVVPESLDMDIFDGIPRITDEKMFLNSINDDSLLSSEAAKSIEFHFGSGKGKMAYLQIADICEEFITGEREGYFYDYGCSKLDMTNSGKLKIILWNYIKIIAFGLVVFFKISYFPFLKQKHQDKIKRYKQDVFDGQKLFRKYRMRLKPFVERNKKQVSNGK